MSSQDRSAQNNARSQDGATTTQAKETREKIIATANRLFHVYGYQKTTIADIARELEMSPANVYRFFASKAALTKAVTIVVTDECINDLRKIADRKNLSASEKLREMARFHFNDMRERFMQDRKMHELLEAAMEEAWEEIERHKNHIRELIAQTISEGMDAGEFARHDPKTAALLFKQSLIMFFHPSLISQAIRCLPDDCQDLMFEPMVDFALAALRDGTYRAPARNPYDILLQPACS